MNTTRRDMLSHATGTALIGLLATAGLLPATARADWSKAAFDARTMPEAVKALGGGAPAESRDITLTGPDIAENGAVVPIEVTSNIPGTTSISVLIEKNPFPLAAKFDFKEGALPYVKINAKIGETSNVRVIAEAGGKTFSAMKEVKVTIGGCGG